MQIEKGIDKLVKTVRVMILDKPGFFGKVATAIGVAGGNIGDIRLVEYGLEYNTRDVTIFVDSDAQLQVVLEELGKVEGVIISDIIDPVLEMHRGGKISVKSRITIDSISTIRKVYTRHPPGRRAGRTGCRAVLGPRDNPDAIHNVHLDPR